MLLTRDQILNVSDLPFEDVEVPEWGGTVRVRTMTGAGKDAFEMDVVQGEGKLNYRNFRAKLLARTLIDEAGNLLFAEDEVELLGAKSAKAIERVFAVAKRINAISEEDQKELSKN